MLKVRLIEGRSLGRDGTGGEPSTVSGALEQP